jgi:hypothetical protein
MVKKKFRGSATKKKNGGWHIEIDGAFNKELANMSPEDRHEIEMIMEGIKNGSIDPLKLGNTMCSYCGYELGDVPNGIIMCKLCANELK